MNVLVRGQCRTPVVRCGYGWIGVYGRVGGAAGRLVEGCRPGDGQGAGPAGGVDGAVRRCPQGGGPPADRRPGRRGRGPRYRPGEFVAMEIGLAVTSTKYHVERR